MVKDNTNLTPPTETPVPSVTAPVPEVPTGTDEFMEGLVPVGQEPPEVAEARAEQERAAAANIGPRIGVIDEIDPASVQAIAGAVGLAPDAIQAAIHQALAGQRAEIGALRQELATVKAGGGGDLLTGENASIGGYPWMYWRKPATWPDTLTRLWVVVGPGGVTPRGHRDAGSYSRYLKKGFEPITRYGYIDVPKTPEAVIDYLPMLRAGGAVEFPVSQVVAYNWHIRPPILDIVFPQYEKVKGSVISFICEACGFQQWFTERGAESGNSYRSHLMQSHKYPFREAAEAVSKQGFDLAPYAAPMRA